MDYLVDTNVLLRLADPYSDLFPVAQRAVKYLHAAEHTLWVSTQNCIEFWNVATRPIEKNGFGLPPAAANDLLLVMERMFPLLPEYSFFMTWRDLVTSLSVSGVQVHDASLVARMLSHGISHILTFDSTDFQRYSVRGVVAIDPKNVPV